MANFLSGLMDGEVVSQPEVVASQNSWRWRVTQTNCALCLWLLVLLMAAVLIPGCKVVKRESAVKPAATDMVQLYPYIEKKMWGYIDSSGAVVIPAQFTFAGTFSDGLARVMMDQKWGYADRKGALVVPAQYEKARPFSDGMAAVRVDKKYGYIDLHGNMKVPPQFPKTAGKFTEGLAPVPDTTTGKWGYIDHNGTWVIPATYDKAGQFSMGRAPVKMGDRYGYIAHNGDLATAADFYWADSFSGGVGRVRTGTPPNVKYAFVDTTGRVLFTSHADETYPMSEEMARIHVGEKWGYLNQRGEIAIPAKFDFAFDFKEGLAAVRQGDGWGYISPSGQFVIPPQFLVAEQFQGGVAYVTFKGGWGYINRSGKIFWKTEPGAPVAGVADETEGSE